MKLKKVLGLLLALTVACSVLVSCGDDEDSSSKKSKKNDSAVSAAADSDEDSNESDVKIDASEEDDSSDKEDDSKEDESSKEDDKDSSEDDKKDDSSKDDKKNDVSENPALDADIDDLEGKWECEYMEVNGVQMTDFMGIPVAAMMQLEFKDGGKGVITGNSNGGNAEVKEFTWSTSGNKCTVTAEGQGIDFELKDNRLVAEVSNGEESEKISLKKVKKFTEFDFDALKDSLGQLIGDMSDLDLDDFDFGGND